MSASEYFILSVCKYLLPFEYQLQGKPNIPN